MGSAQMYMDAKKALNGFSLCSGCCLNDSFLHEGFRKTHTNFHTMRMASLKTRFVDQLIFNLYSVEHFLKFTFSVLAGRENE